MARRCFMIGKIYRATVTEARPDYEGSLSICPGLLEASGIKVVLMDARNGIVRPSVGLAGVETARDN